MEVLGIINGIPFGEEIYLCSHRFGYKIDIFHKALAQYLIRYRIHAKAVVGPLGDNQRCECEAYMDKIIHLAREKYKEKTAYPTVEVGKRFT